jgi:WD40 repeat protein
LRGVCAASQLAYGVDSASDCAAKHAAARRRRGAAMAAFQAKDGLQARLVPGPSLERGHAFSIKAHPKEPKLIYCFGKYVIVRSLTDAGDNFVYRGHKHVVGAAAFSPSGYWVASGDAAGFLRVWAWDNPEHILKVEVQVFAGAIKDVQWDGESKRIVAVGAGSNIKAKCIMWDTGNGVGEMVGHQKTVLSVAYRQQRPFRIFTGSEDFKCVFYKGPPFKLDHSCTEHSNYVNAVAYSRDGARIVSVGSDKKIIIYEGTEGTVLETLKAKDPKRDPQGSVYCCVFSEDGKRLLTGGADKTLKVWRVGSSGDALESSTTMGTDVADMQLGVFWGHGQALSVSLAGDFNYLNVTGTGCTTRKKMQAPSAPVSCLCVAQGAIVVGCNDGTVFCAQGTEWTKASGSAPRSICRAAHGGKVTSVCATSAGFASCGFDDKVRFAIDGVYNDVVVGVEGQPLGLGGLGGGVAVATTKGVGIITDGAVAAFEATAWDPTALATHGSLIAVGAKDGVVRIFDLNLKEVFASGAHRAQITALALSPDGALLAAGDAEREIKVYDAARKYELALSNKWRHHNARVTALAWGGHTGRALGSTSTDETVFVWDFAKPAVAAREYKFAHKDGGLGLAWKGAGLVSAGHDGCVCVWDA